MAIKWLKIKLLLREREEQQAHSVMGRARNTSWDQAVKIIRVGKGRSEVPRWCGRQIRSCPFYLLPGHPFIQFCGWLRSLSTCRALCHWSCQGSAASSLHSRLGKLCLVLGFGYLLLCLYNREETPAKAKMGWHPSLEDHSWKLQGGFPGCLTHGSHTMLSNWMQQGWPLPNLCSCMVHVEALPKDQLHHCLFIQQISNTGVVWPQPWWAANQSAFPFQVCQCPHTKLWFAPSLAEKVTNGLS